jgi:hypothetical protein
MKLYTYCLKVDDGAAPNPFWGVCTLAICKPAIRRTASPKDWVVGLGSKNDKERGDISDHVIYAMRVSDSLSMWDYDKHCRGQLESKIPDRSSADYRRRAGDCIYDFSRGAFPVLRKGVHDERNRDVDLGGRNVLLSDHFYYFGDRAVRLPPRLRPIVHSGQGHKSNKNDPWKERFVDWIESMGYEPCRLIGEPLHRSLLTSDDYCEKCAPRDLRGDESDGEC